MTIITTINTLKRQYTEHVIILKVGEFYHVYGMDACIISYLFDYKVRVTDKLGYTCGFPINNILKIQEELELNSISYILIDKDAEIKKDYNCKEKNRYEDISKKAYSYVKVKEKIENINKYLLMNMNQIETLALISQIDEIINGY